jgi:hypothetical protein
MRHSIKCFSKSLDQILYCSLEKPSNTYLQDVGQVAEQVYRTVMSGCIGLVDGSIHPLEKDQAAQWNIYDKKNHSNYNKWKLMQCKKGLTYYFVLLVLIISF